MTASMGGGAHLGTSPDHDHESGAHGLPEPADRWAGPSLPASSQGQVALVVVLPDDGAARKLGLESLRSLRRRVTDGVVVVFEEDSLGRLRGVDVSTEESAARAAFRDRLGRGRGGIAALLDSQHQVRAAGSLDVLMFEHFEMLVDHGLVPFGERVRGVSSRLREADDNSVESMWESPLMVGQGPSLILEPDAMAEVARRDRAEFESAFDTMFATLANRPLARLEITLDYARLSPELVRESKVRRELKRRQREHARSPFVQLAVTEAALLGNDLRLTQRSGYAYLDCAKGLPGGASQLLDLMSESPRAESLDRLMEHALSVGLVQEPGDPKLLRQQFDFHLQVRDDHEAAVQSGRRLIDAYGEDSRGLNALAWSLLTEDRYRGRFPGLALEAARAMERDPDWRVSWRLDTYALAAFDNGLVSRAVELQRQAVATCGSGSKPRYEERLRRYEDQL
ncbi:MAG: hypothetical protein AAF196_03160 [Planctomycetota bacterium]